MSEHFWPDEFKKENELVSIWFPIVAAEFILRRKFGDNLYEDTQANQLLESEKFRRDAGIESGEADNLATSGNPEADKEALLRFLLDEAIKIKNEEGLKEFCEKHSLGWLSGDEHRAVMDKVMEVVSDYDS